MSRNGRLASLCGIMPKGVPKQTQTETAISFIKTHKKYHKNSLACCGYLLVKATPRIVRLELVLKKKKERKKRRNENSLETAMLDAMLVTRVGAARALVSH